MRILHILPTYLPATRYGGPIYSVHGLAQATAGLGHDVEVYTTNVDGDGVSPVPTSTPIDLDGVKVTYFPTELGRRLYRSPTMAAALDRTISSFDIVHLHSVFLWPTLAAARAAHKAHVPYIVAPRGMLVADLIRRKSSLAKRVWITLFERHTIEAAAAVHVTAPIEAREIKALGFKMRQFVEVPNGIEQMPALVDAAPPERPYVLSLGRISWKKGLDRLIAAMAHVPSHDLVIAGNDEEGLRPRLAALAAASGVAERVCFVGHVEGAAKWRLLRQASTFALPSLSENFAISVLEAMAAGIPVVVTPEVGLADAVVSTGCGVVVGGEPDTLGPALAELLADAGRCRDMGAAGRRAVEAKFTWDAIARRMVVAYQEIVTGAAHA